MPAHRVANYGKHGRSNVGINHESLGQSCDVLRLESIRHVVALGQAFEVVENATDIGASFNICQAHRRAAFQHMRPGRSGLNSLFPKNSLVHRTPTYEFFEMENRTGTN